MIIGSFFKTRYPPVDYIRIIACENERVEYEYSKSKLKYNMPTGAFFLTFKLATPLEIIQFKKR